MNTHHRTTAAFALLAVAGLALTACDPTAAPAPTVTVTVTAAPSPSASPADASPATAATAPATGAPAPRPTCSEDPHPTEVELLIAVSATPERITFRKAQIVCQDGREWESRFVPTGPAFSYPTTTGTSIQLLTATGKMDEYASATRERFAAHVNTCAKGGHESAPFKCYGNLYLVGLSSNVQITTVEESPTT